MAELNNSMENHHRIIFEILQCVRLEITTPVVPTTEKPPVTSTKAPLIKNVLGENLYTSLQELFSPEYDSDTSLDATEPREPFATAIVGTREQITCKSLKKYNIDLTESEQIIWCALGLVIFLFFFLLCIIVVKRRIQRSTARADIDVCEPSSSKTNVSDDLADEQSLTENAEEHSKSVNTTVEEAYIKVPLSYQLRTHKPYHTSSQFDLTTFLSNISETLFTKLDQLLLKDPLVDQTRSHATIATPRLARRPLGNRQRTGSSPTLQFLVGASDESGSSFIEKKQAWDTFKTFTKEISWKRPDYLQFEDSKFDRKNQRLIHFYQRVCPIKSDHWKATAFLTNFTLFLLQAEKESLVCQNGYRFVKFIPTGSGKTGTMVGRPNQFDVLMVLQSPVNPTFTVVEDKKEVLPPGQVLIGAELPEGASVAARETTCYVRLDKDKLVCLSSKEFSRAAAELIESSIVSLYTKTRSLMDRLPFVIRKSPTADLTVSIDTRSLVGLGLPEVKINIIPALPLTLNGWYQSGSTYAVPLPEELEYKARPRSTTSVSEDCLWQINCDELSGMFMQGVDSKMKHAGVESCHLLCLMILKTLFTGKDKNSLLDKGSIQSFVLINALNFLLLESTPDQWSVENLSDRFSDLIHFLRSALRNGRLPNFFINNPHLINKMPAVAGNQILLRKRQRNLLADFPREKLDRCLDYIESSITDARLADLVKEDYSDSMWEYEFFIFN